MIKPLPEKYAWLAKETGPRILIEALAQHGTLERPGVENNPIIIEWAKEVGGDIAHVYNSDDIPWCGLFIAVCAHRAGLKLPDKPLWAKSWIRFGQPVPSGEPELGDVLVFNRPGGGGHVGLYVGEDTACYHVLGGNQSDQVNITRLFKSRLYGVRRTKWKVAQPPNVRKVRFKDGGEVSRNEA